MPSSTLQRSSTCSSTGWSKDAAVVSSLFECGQDQQRLSLQLLIVQLLPELWPDLQQHYQSPQHPH